jgi:hypothetical protein
MTMLGVSLKTVMRVDVKNWFKAIGILLLIGAAISGVTLVSIQHPIIVISLISCIALVIITWGIKKELDG